MSFCIHNCALYFCVISEFLLKIGVCVFVFLSVCLSIFGCVTVLTDLLFALEESVSETCRGFC